MITKQKTEAFWRWVIVIAVIISVTAMICFGGCGIPLTDHYQDYVIPAGEHSGDKIQGSVNRPELTFHFIANWTMIYDIPENNGWSKVCGLSERMNPHQNSARITWQTQIIKGESALLIGLYVWSDGINPSYFGGTKMIVDTLFNLPKEISVRITKVGITWVFRYNNKEYRIDGGGDGSKWWILNPYVGGTYTINHNVIIPIRL